MHSKLNTFVAKKKNPLSSKENEPVKKKKEEVDLDSKSRAKCWREKEQKATSQGIKKYLIQKQISDQGPPEPLAR